MMHLLPALLPRHGISAPLPYIPSKRHQPPACRSTTRAGNPVPDDGIRSPDARKPQARQNTKTSPPARQTGSMVRRHAPKAAEFQAEKYPLSTRLPPPARSPDKRLAFEY